MYYDQSRLVSAEKSITALHDRYICHATDGNDSLQTTVTAPPFGSSHPSAPRLNSPERPNGTLYPILCRFIAATNKITISLSGKRLIIDARIFLSYYQERFVNGDCITEKIYRQDRISSNKKK